MRAQPYPQPPKPPRVVSQSSLLYSFETTFRHLNEGRHVVVGAEGVLDVAQQVVRLQDQDHLTVHEGKHIGDLLHVPCSVLLYFISFRFILDRNLHTLLERTPRPGSDHAGEESVELSDPQEVGGRLDALHVTVNDRLPEVRIVVPELC